MPEPRRPLDGVKCVAIAMFHQLPIALTFMADMGAEVIKIERPGIGERGRLVQRSPKTPVSPYFETNDRGLKSLTVDIQSKEGQEIIYKLVQDADVFAQNYRPGVAERHHFGYEDLCKVNPAIVYLACSAFGPDGPKKNLPGTDALGQAIGGIASVFGEVDTPMSSMPVTVADETASYINFGAIMLGLYYKKTLGQGLKIDTSLLGTQIRLMGFNMTKVLMTGENLPRYGRVRISSGEEEDQSIAASFKDINGKPFVVQIIGGLQWNKAVEVSGFRPMLEEVGCADLKEVTKSKEKQNTLIKTFDKLFATDTRENWVDKLRAADIISAPINTILEASKDPDVIANNYVVEIDHPTKGKLKEVGYPWKFSKFEPKRNIASELGQHNNEILGRIGYSQQQIEDLKKRKIV